MQLDTWRKKMEINICFLNLHMKKYNDVFNRIREKIKEVNSGEYDYEKDYIKIKFNSDHNLPLKKQ